MKTAQIAPVKIEGTIPLIRSGNYLSWSEEIRSKLRSLTLNGYSGMREQIEPDGDPLTCVAFLEDEPIGWSLYVPLAFGVRHLLMVYVHVNHRRMGVGRTLIVAIKASAGILSPTVAAWSGESYKFYSRIYENVGLNIREWYDASQSNETRAQL